MEYFTICIDYGGSLYSFGENYAGQLGTGNTNQYNFPQKVQDIPVGSISCGVFHTLVLTYDADLILLVKMITDNYVLGIQTIN